MESSRDRRVIQGLKVTQQVSEKKKLPPDRKTTTKTIENCTIKKNLFNQSQTSALLHCFTDRLILLFLTAFLCAWHVHARRDARH